MPVFGFINAGWAADLNVDRLVSFFSLYGNDLSAGAGQGGQAGHPVRQAAR